MAVYLSILGGLTREEVAEKMGVQEGTIRKYISEYKQGER
ncbi:sigma factor-like helix-turn-helix DNA-binding protein [Halovivax limisalsi]